MAKRIQVGGRIESKEVGGIVTGAAEILDDAKGKKQSVINEETDDELLRLDQSKQDNLTFDNAPTEGSDNPVKSGGVYVAEKALSDAIEAIMLLIPSAASALNKLVDTSMMNSSISTATATFKGTYNVVTDLSLTVDATHEQIAAALGNVISTADNNDYAFVQVPVSAESMDIRRTERYKFNGTAWGYEYDLNTSGFTAAQWAAINSGITLALVGKLIGLPTSSELQALLGQKQDTLAFDNVPTAGSANPVKSGGVYSAINDEKTAREQLAQTVTGIDGRVENVEGVIPTGAAANNKLVANNSMEAYVTSIIEAITASFTIATVDGHINLTLTQTNGRVASLTLTSSDIASAQALTALTGRVSTAESDITSLGGRMTTAEDNITSIGGRVSTAERDITSLGGRLTNAEGNITTAEGNITTLGGRVSTNETDIANLQQLYNDLQQSKPVPVTALPKTGQQQGVIYRLAGTTSYSDYMWNGSTWVLMATYNNAIDEVPTAGSDNLVKSGGVYESVVVGLGNINKTEIESYPVTPLLSVQPRVHAYIQKDTLIWVDLGYGLFLDVYEGDSITVTAPDNDGSVISFLRTDNIVIGGKPSFAGGDNRYVISAGNTQTFTAPVGTKYLFVMLGAGTENMPSNVVINHITRMVEEPLQQQVNSITERLNKKIKDGGTSITENISDLFTWESGKFINGCNPRLLPDMRIGDINNSSYETSNASGFVNVSGYETLNFTIPCLGDETSAVGAAFYDEEMICILGISKASMSPTGMTEISVDIPYNAVYFRTTWREDLGDFECYGVKKQLIHRSYEQIRNDVNALVSMSSLQTSIKAFGAIGDGVSDDTDAIQNAFYSNYHTIVIPAGTYLINKTIIIPTGKKIIGEGLSRSVIQLANNYTLTPEVWRDDVLYPILKTADNSKDIILQDFGLNGADWQNMRQVGICVENADNVTIKECAATNINYNANYNESYNPYKELAYSLFIWKSKNVVVDGGYYSHGGYENLGTEDAENIHIQNAFFGVGWRTSVQFHRNTNNVTFSNNTIHQVQSLAHSMLTIHGTSDKPVSNIHINNNKIYGTTNISETLRGGIQCVGGAENDIYIDNNFISVNNYAITYSRQSSIYGGSLPKNYFITNNIIKAKYGIDHIEGNNFICKNNIIDSTSKAINVEKAYYIVKNNILLNNTEVTLSGTEWHD